MSREHVTLRLTKRQAEKADKMLFMWQQHFDTCDTWVPLYEREAAFILRRALLNATPEAAS